MNTKMFSLVCICSLVGYFEVPFPQQQTLVAVHTAKTLISFNV